LDLIHRIKFVSN